MNSNLLYMDLVWLARCSACTVDRLWKLIDHLKGPSSISWQCSANWAWLEPSPKMTVAWYHLHRKLARCCWNPLAWKFKDQTWHFSPLSQCGCDRKNRTNLTNRPFLHIFMIFVKSVLAILPLWYFIAAFPLPLKITGYSIITAFDSC